MPSHRLQAARREIGDVGLGEHPADVVAHQAVEVAAGQKRRGRSGNRRVAPGCRWLPMSVGAPIRTSRAPAPGADRRAGPGGCCRARCRRRWRRSRPARSRRTRPPRAGEAIGTLQGVGCAGAARIDGDDPEFLAQPLDDRLKHLEAIDHGIDEQQRLLAGAVQIVGDAGVVARAKPVRCRLRSMRWRSSVSVTSAPAAS